MAVKDVFSAHLLTESGYQDITSGILNVNIEFGTDVYEGPQQQIDTGLFTIVSRNPLVDPKVNSNVTEGATIVFRDSRNVEAGKSNDFFEGYITDIDVQYQREDDPIITITGTDAFGLLQRTVVTEDFRNMALSGSDTAGPELNGPNLQYLTTFGDVWYNTSTIDVNVVNVLTNPSTPGGIDPALPYYNYLGYSPARYLPDLGETFLEVLNKYTQTNLNYCSINYRENSKTIDVYPYAKYNPLFWTRTQDPTLEFPVYNFSSDPADNRPYETILVKNNYNRKTNSLSISNETRLWDGLTFNDPIVSTTTTYPSVTTFGNNITQPVTTSLNTIFATDFIDNGSLELYAQDIFEAVNFGTEEVQQITFDNARKQDIDDDYTYSFSQLNQFIRIKHRLSSTQIIDRFYDIAGIRHNISPDKWEMGFTFKPSQNEIAYNFQPQVPTIQMNALTGDSNFNFTATITNFPTQDIEEVIWCLNGTNGDIIEQWPYTASGERFKDGLPRNGLTQTWNFDDDGILDGPVIPTGGYGTGEWYVIPYIIMKNGWVATSSIKLTVGTPAVEARFTWQQNLTNNFGQVTFIDDSRNNEIGEPDSYLWTFGDGTTSTLQNPVKVYDPAPTQTQYTVSLKVFTYGPGQVKIYNTKTSTITLARPTMAPDFTWTSNFEVVTFTNTSVNVGLEEPDAYFWEFGDGTTSTLKNPVKSFPVTNANVPTNFSVKLTTRNIWEQTASITKTVPVLAQNTSGTYPVKYIKLSTPVISRSGTGLDVYALTPVFSDFKARTSNTNESLIENAPLINFGNFYEPQFRYHSADVSGSAPKEVYNLSKYLTRSEYDILPYTTTEMVGVGVTISQGTQNLLVRHELVIQVPESAWYKIDKIQSFVRNVRINGVSQIENYNPKINVDFATTIGGYTPNPSNVYGPPSLNGDWVNVGYFKFNTGYIFETASITKLRPFPMNIPYFLYTFGTTVAGTDKQVSFTSVETAPSGGSYLWTFGDGTTSTLKDPVKTYATYGTKTVNLTIRNSSNVILRSTTEPVIVQPTII